jgi:hypothetical protein
VSGSASKKKKKLRPAGDILLDVEKLYFELVESHGYQKGDLLANTNSWADVHLTCVEEYDVGGHPIFFYGSIENLKKLAEKI